MLPKTAEDITNGGLYLQSVRCGKPNCICVAGYLHEGYYYFIRRVDGRLRKSYVPKRLVDELRNLVDESRLARELERRMLTITQVSLQEMALFNRGQSQATRQLSYGNE